MRMTVIPIAIVLFGLPAVVEQEQEKGVKALILDTLSGRMKMPTAAGPARKGDSGALGASRLPAITGLLYYFELLQA